MAEKPIQPDHPLRIAMFGQKHTFSREGGIEIVVTQLATRFASLGHRVTCYDRAGRNHDRKKHPGIRIRHVATLNLRGLAALTSSVCAAFCAAFSKNDIIHIHAEGPAAMCRFLKRTGHKVVVTCHGLDWQREKWGRFARWYLHLGEKCAVRWADEIIVLTRHCQEYFEKTYGRNTVVIPNAAEEHPFPSSDLLSRWGLEKDGYVLSVGRIVPEKGFQYLLEAWRTIRTDKKLVICGGTFSNDPFLQELKQKADDRVLFTGFLDGDNLWALYSNAYVFVLPSDLEGMSISLCEAMSFGNCCLTSDIPECVEVITDHAPTFHASDTEDLKRHLSMLLDSPQTVQHYKKDAAGYIMRRYNWDDIAQQTLCVYRKILEQ